MFNNFNIILIRFHSDFDFLFKVVTYLLVKTLNTAFVCIKII